MDQRMKNDLDNYITGHYGEDQFRDKEDPGLCPDDLEGMSAHERAFRSVPTNGVYSYDPADDGPECEVITRILASHPLYIPGMERPDGLDRLTADQRTNLFALWRERGPL